VQQFQPFGRNHRVQISYARDIAARVTKAGDEAETEGISGRFKDNRNGCGFCLRRKRRWSPGCGNHGDLVMNQLGYKQREPIGSIVRPAKFNREVLTFDIAHFLQAATEGGRHGWNPSADAALTNPTVGIADCCARDVSGHAEAATLSRER
jgi:hypothetical protein